MIKIALRLLLILLPLGGMARTQQDSLRVLWVGTEDRFDPEDENFLHALP